VGSRHEDGVARPCAVGEYLCERMVRAGVDKICFVVSPGKSDIMEYFGGAFGEAFVTYAVQPEPLGLCDAIFRAAPLAADDEPVLVGLPDTIWQPVDGFASLPNGTLSFLLFPVADPSAFDAVSTDETGRVTRIEVKSREASSRWIWGAFKMNGRILRELEAFWRRRDRRDEFIGTLVDAWIAEGGRAIGVRDGETYLDVGTFEGYRAAVAMLAESAPAQAGRRVPALRGAPVGRSSPAFGGAQPVHSRDDAP
jgi:glucose-1-phosphate thymidylyltransferase